MTARKSDMTRTSLWRRTLHWAKLSAMTIPNLITIGRLFLVPLAVSYTHLDVYKRQLQFIDQCKLKRPF